MIVLSIKHHEHKMIMNSWCKDFADIVFPAIKEERFSVLYSDIKIQDQIHLSI